MSNKLWKNSSVLVRIFLSCESVPQITPIHLTVRKFLMICYEKVMEDNSEQIDSSEDETSKAPPNGSISLRNKIEDTDIRRTVIQFGRCFISGSIAGFIMRRERSIPAARISAKALTDFSGCSHLPTSEICDGCVNFLKTIATQVASNIPAASRLACEICHAKEYGTEDIAALKELPRYFCIR